MATSQDMINQVTGIQNQMNPLLDFQGQAPEFFQQGLNKAFNYNLPLLKEGAALEAGAYALPGQLLNQYKQDYGNVFGGASAGQRINSILGRLGNQFGLVDLASKLATQQSGRIEDMAKNLTQQYGLSIDALKAKMDPALQLAQLLSAKEEAAADRANQASIAAANRAASDASAMQFQKFLENQKDIQNLESTTTTPSTVVNSNGSKYSSPFSLNLTQSYGLFPNPASNFLNSPNPLYGKLK